MKKLISLLILGATLATTGCIGAQTPVPADVAKCRQDVVVGVLGDTASTVLADVLTGKVDLVTVLQQAGKTYNEVFAAVLAYRECSPGAQDNPSLPKPEAFKK